MKTYLPILFLSFCSMLFAEDEAVIITNSEGKELKVVIINVKDDKVKARTTDKFTSFEIPLNKLSQSSQDLLKEWVKDGNNISKDISITAQFSRGDVKDKKSQKVNNQKNKNKGNQKNKNQTQQRVITETRTYSVTPKISVRNRDTEFETKTGSAVIFVYPKPKQGAEKQKITIATIEALRTEEFSGAKVNYSTTETTTITTKNGVPRSSKKRSGQDFGGYAVFVLDSEGNIIAEKATKQGDLDRYRSAVN